MHFSYRDNCLIGICWLESHENKSERCLCVFALPFFFLRRSRSYPNPSVLSMQITCRRVDIHYAARLWLDMKLSCCLHQLWLRGLSGLCSNAVWEWRRYSNKAIRVNWPQSNVLYLCSPWLGSTDISITLCFFFFFFVLSWTQSKLRNYSSHRLHTNQHSAPHFFVHLHTRSGLYIWKSSACYQFRQLGLKARTSSWDVKLWRL